MRNTRFVGLCALFALAIAAACSDSTAPGRGTVIVQMHDAPFPTDSVEAVNIFVTRVDARVKAADSAASDSALAEDSAAAHGWITLAEPNAVFDLLELQNGVFAVLDTMSVAAGNYTSIRLVIDPSQSNVTLKNGMVLTGTSAPNVSFPSGSSSGIKVNISGGLTVIADDTAVVSLDFDLDQSFVMRGNSISQLGLLFKPVVRASVSQ